MKKVLVLLMVAMLATAVQAANISSSFTNLDFDADGVDSGWPKNGFDNVSGWTNWRNGAPGPLNDAGTEGEGAWWLSDAYREAYGIAAFMSSGDAAYNMSSYIIQADDVFTISYIGGEWGWTGDLGQWTATLFYDDPANVIGTYVQNITSWMPDGVWYSDAIGIAATPESVGGTLGILLTNTGTRIVQVDEISVAVVPEPATLVLLGLGSLVIARKRK